MLYGYIKELPFADATNREGHAAKVYFNALFGLDFTRTEENSINATLNYGYSLLLSAFRVQSQSLPDISQIPYEVRFYDDAGIGLLQVSAK